MPPRKIAGDFDLYVVEYELDTPGPLVPRREPTYALFICNSILPEAVGMLTALVRDPYASDDWSPVFLRSSTMSGLSIRGRWTNRRLLGRIYSSDVGRIMRDWGQAACNAAIADAGEEDKGRVWCRFIVQKLVGHSLPANATV